MSSNTWTQASPQPSHDYYHHRGGPLSRSMSAESTASGFSQDTTYLSRSPYTIHDHQSTQSQSLGAYPPWGGSNAGSSSTLSLGPPPEINHITDNGRRRLLLIYIHGFMGEEASFHKFPAHVHNLVTIGVAESHAVYTKVYPRYKSRRAMDIAVNDFSRWLSPHESEDTDVILLGHSLGGILSAEVALLPSGPGSSQILRHRILGLINFDVPFLGIHPRVIPTGIGSLFNPRSPSPQRPPHDASPTATDLSDSISHKLSSVDLDDKDEDDCPFPNPFAVPSHDPNFDPAFPNDIRFARRNQLDGALHFIKKNSNHLVSAVQGYFKSYFEFGGCLLDYSGLKSRYRKLIELEGIDELDLKRDAQGRLRRRVRFVNYYTASTGFVGSREPSPSSMTVSENMRSDTQLTMSISETTLGQEGVEGQARSRMSSPQLHAGDPHAEAENSNVLTIDDVSLPQVNIDADSPHERSSSIPSIIESLPPLPSLPDEPSTFDPSRYDDKDIIKIAQKEHTRLVKAYERAKKDHEKAIKDREKLAKKLEKAATKRLVQEQQKAAAAAVKQNVTTNKDNEDKGSGVVVIVQEEEKTETSSSSTVYASFSAPSSRKAGPPLPPRKPNTNLATITDERKSEDTTYYHHDDSSAIFSEQPPPAASSLSSAPPPPPPQPNAKPNPPTKDRKFCALPSSSTTTANGQSDDSLWVRIFMSGIDEVVAHQSMFLPNDTYYEQLVGDTATRIERWVQDDCTRRVILSQLLQGEETTEPLD